MLKSISLNFNIVNTSFKPKKNLSFCGAKPLCEDCFVKQPKTKEDKQEADITGEDFIKWADKTGFLNRGVKILLNQKNQIGEGIESYVYQIPGNEDYVLRIRKENSMLDFEDCVIVDDTDKDLHGNFGQCIAKIKSKDYTEPYIEVLIKQKGIPNGNPPNGTLCRKVDYHDISRKEYCEKCLKILAGMPSSSYENFVDDLIYLAQKGCRIDTYNSNNYLLDEENKSINIVDIGKGYAPYEPQLGSLIYSLIDLRFINTYFEDLDLNNNSDMKKKDEITKNVTTIIDKYTKAMKSKGQKYSLENDTRLPPVLKSGVSDEYFQTSDYNEKIKILNENGVLQ